MSISNRQTMDFFSDIANRNPHKGAVKFNSSSDMSEIDAKFISRFLRPDISLLDLASGDGLVLDKIDADVKSITAVEPFEGFSRHIIRRPNLEIINATLQEFEPAKEYDLVSMFGIMHYFSATEAREIYSKYWHYVSPGGMIIVKNQFGIKNDVVVNGYSESLGRDYFAEYRTLDHEKKLISDSGFEIVECYDIYSPECNHWDNTHYYAIVASKADK